MVIALKAETNQQEKWIKLILKFHQELRDNLKENFVELIAPPDPDISLHDINVVVVVKKVNSETRKLVAEIARKVEKEMKIGIVLITLTLEQGDPLVDEYKLAFSGSGISKHQWDKLISSYKTLLQNAIKENFVELIAPPDPDISLHDINVVVVVKKVNSETRKLVAEIARKVEKEMKMGITLITLTLEQDDPLVDEYRGYFKGES